MAKTRTRTPTTLLRQMLLTLLTLTRTRSQSTDTFIYGGCSQIKFPPNSGYESNLNSVLTSIVNSAMTSTYNKFTVFERDITVYGLFQCRGDLSSSDCGTCVASAVSQLGNLCHDSCGGALQLDGCHVKYDNASFLGVEDKTVVFKRCGPSKGYGTDVLTRRDAVVDYLGAESTDGVGSFKYYRMAGSGDVSSVAQCTQDLSGSGCQDCLSDSIGRLKSECGGSSWGDVYLATCYARFTIGDSRMAHGGPDNESSKKDDNVKIPKTLAIAGGFIAGVALLGVFLSCLRKAGEKSRR